MQVLKASKPIFILGGFALCGYAVYSLMSGKSLISSILDSSWDAVKKVADDISAPVVKEYHHLRGTNYYRGTGYAPKLEACPDGWVNDGLICREVIEWKRTNNGTFPYRLTGGALVGRLNNGGQCPAYPPGLEMVNGRCMPKCAPGFVGNGLLCSAP